MLTCSSPVRLLKMEAITRLKKLNGTGSRWIKLMSCLIRSKRNARLILMLWLSRLSCYRKIQLPHSLSPTLKAFNSCLRKMDLARLLDSRDGWRKRDLGLRWPSVSRLRKVLIIWLITLISCLSKLGILILGWRNKLINRFQSRFVWIWCRL